MNVEHNSYDYKGYLNKLEELKMYQLKLTYYLFDQTRILCYNITIELENMIEYTKKIQIITSNIYEHNQFRILMYLIKHNRIPVQLASSDEEVFSHIQNKNKNTSIIMTEKSYHHLIVMKHIILKLFKFQKDLFYYIYVLYSKLLFIISGMENYTKIFNFCILNN